MVHIQTHTEMRHKPFLNEKWGETDSCVIENVLKRCKTKYPFVIGHKQMLFGSGSISIYTFKVAIA